MQSVLRIVDVAAGRLGNLARRARLDPLVDAVRPRFQRAVRRGRSGKLGEERVLAEVLAHLGVVDGWAVDIGAWDGVDGSNTFPLFERGWQGLAVEGDPERFASLARTYRRFPGVGLARAWFTPDTVVPLLEAHGAPTEFTVLSLDIDGYDHFVLRSLLDAFRPVVVLAEINEKIPPPVKFAVTYDPDYVWAEDHFFGQSIAKLQELADAHGYALVQLHYNNALLVPAEHGLPSLTAEEAYCRGYLAKPDRLEIFPWNADMEAIHALDPEGMVAFLNERFAEYAGRYVLDV